MFWDIVWHTESENNLFQGSWTDEIVDQLKLLKVSHTL